jgi:hypothetical protein
MHLWVRNQLLQTIAPDAVSGDWDELDCSRICNVSQSVRIENKSVDLPKLDPTFKSDGKTQESEANLNSLNDHIHGCELSDAETRALATLSISRQF